MNRPLLAWPSRDELRLTGAMTAGFTLFFLLIYGGASWVTGFYTWGLRVDLPFERAIPFEPAWSSVYVSMNGMLLLSLLILRTWREMVPFVLALAVETLVGGVCFLLLPVHVAWAVREVHGAHAGLFALADTMNLERNYLPSLHVAFACTAALAYGERGGRLARGVFALWALAIAASTLFIHEHHVADVLTGALLAWGTWRLVSPRASREKFLAALRLEALCLRECFHFSRRHPRYLLVALVLYRHALPRWSATRVARTGFCFLQLVDDVLDGDRPSRTEPLDWVDGVLAHLEQGSEEREDEDVAVTLGRAFLAELGDARAREDALRLVRVMREDRERVRTRAELDTEALLAHHRDTFRLSMGLLLTVARADVRVADVPALIELLGWCSTMRDLREDLAQGLYNVPAEVTQAVRLEGAQPWDFEALVGSVAGRAWLLAEHQRARILLEHSQRELAALEGRAGVEVARLFHRSIERFWARRLPRRLGFLRQPEDVSWRPSGAP